MIVRSGWCLGRSALHDLMGIAVDAAELQSARTHLLQRHHVLDMVTPVDPWRRPDLDHAPVEPDPKQRGAASSPI